LYINNFPTDNEANGGIGNEVEIKIEESKPGKRLGKTRLRCLYVWSIEQGAKKCFMEILAG
jgi:hypothetical protein